MSDTIYGIFRADSEEEAALMMFWIVYWMTYIYGPEIEKISFEVY